ncbi:MAG TPA: MFS transporter [Streptosporangiaceae bacterium]
MGARISQKGAVGVVFVAAMFMSIMDATIVNVALPTIGRDFKVSATAVDSISIAYLVSLAVFIPASGWLGDRLGGKRVLLAAIAVFAAAAICLCAVACSLSIRDADAAATLPGRRGSQETDAAPASSAAV